MPIKVTLWSVAIETDGSGTIHGVYETEDEALRAISDFCRSWWHVEGVSGNPPSDDHECVRLYFEHVDGREWYEIAGVVLGDPLV